MSYDNMSSEALTGKAEQLLAEADAILVRAKKEKRELSRAERKEVDRKTNELDRVGALLEARRFAESPGAPAIACPPTEPRAIFPVARGSVQSEMTYRPDKSAEVSFFRDLVNARDDSDARDRLRVNRAEAEFAHGWSEREAQEYRDMSNVAGAGSEFVPTLYLGALWVEPATGLRPFADSLPSLPLPPTGTTIAIPKLASRSCATHAQNERARHAAGSFRVRVRFAARPRCESRPMPHDPRPASRLRTRPTRLLSSGGSSPCISAEMSSSLRSFLPFARPRYAGRIAFREPPDVSALVAALESRGIRYVITGSVAALLHGVPVDPGDLDVTPSLDRENLKELAMVLAEIDAQQYPDSPFGRWETRDDGEKRWVEFEPTEADRNERANWRPDPKDPDSFDHLLKTTHGALDVVPEIAGTYEDLRARATRLEVDGHPVWVESASDQLATLTVPRRAKDAERVRVLRSIQRDSSRE